MKQMPWFDRRFSFDAPASIFPNALERLRQSMRMLDLMIFVAEHDDHHLARISELRRPLAQTRPPRRSSAL